MQKCKEGFLVFTIVMYEFTKEIQGKIFWCNMFTNYVELVDENTGVL